MKSLLTAATALLSLAFLPPVRAHCPLCLGAVGIAASTATYYGVDQSVVGLFWGAMGISTGLWILAHLRKRWVRFQTQLVIVGSILLAVLPLFALPADSLYVPLLLAGEPGSLLNRVYWVNKLVVGGIIAVPVTLFAWRAHLLIKQVRHRVLFPFQGVVLTVSLLLVAGLGLYVAFG
ncbi:MAG: hypothetical protein HY369_04005 [Candidatus Aenigmarchaeota archaeon]|nr:hypothetical protein [Candidatus Aenigmarchaeota archaeon]